MNAVLSYAFNHWKKQSHVNYCWDSLAKMHEVNVIVKLVYCAIFGFLKALTWDFKIINRNFCIFT